MPPKKAPALRPGLDLTRADLSFEEGVVAARVDGTSTPSDIALLVSMDPAKVVEILARLREKDVLDDGSGRTRDPWDGFIFPLPLMQAEADLSEEERKRVIFTYHGLEEWNHYELLQVRRRDGQLALKKAFQERVKEWHPDRWRRGNLGPFGRMITQIFQRVQTAYGTLSDPKAREAYDAEHAQFYVDQQDLDEMLAQQRRRERDALREKEALARRKGRNPIKKRLEQAREQYRKAVAHEKAGELVEALRAAQTAQTFDPKNERYGALAKRLADATGEERIGPLMKKGLHLEKLVRFEEAIECFEMAVRYAPEHGPARLRLAYNLLQGGRDSEEAREHAQRAVALLSSEAEAHYVLGLCYERADMQKAALREYERAVKLKPNYADAKKRLRNLKWGF